MSAPWMVVAQIELENDVRETPGAGDTPRVLEYIATCSKNLLGARLRRFMHDSTAWCSAFVNWVLLECGIPGTGSALAKSWEKYGIACERKVGAIAIYKRGKLPWQRHVGFVVDIRIDSQDLVLGGNQRNRVSTQWRDNAGAVYRWPHEDHAHDRTQLAS
jgi:uncharacterized protein (TIGR02594 family)